MLGANLTFRTSGAWDSAVSSSGSCRANGALRATYDISLLVNGLIVARVVLVRVEVLVIVGALKQ